MKSADKSLRFPLGGLAKDGTYRDTTYPTDASVYSTPMALNVIGECPFAGRLRGGTRPGLSVVPGVSSADRAKWLWPNGEPILWPSQPTEWTFSGDGDISKLSIEFNGEYSWLFYYDGDLISGYSSDSQATEIPIFASNWFDHQDVAFDFVASRSLGETSHMVFATADSAAMPDGSQIVLQHPLRAVYRDRLIKAEGSVWMASRTGDFGDFDFGRDGDQPTRAVAGNVALAGRKGEDVTALCAIGDRSLYVATKRSLAVVNGEPTQAMSIVSQHVGIVSADAWCNADGVLYFIGANGLYAVSDGYPALLSRQLPRDLAGLGFAILVYDPLYRGIHIFTDRSDWFYSIEQKAFWPVEYPARMMPDAGGVAVVGGKNRVVFHCVDGAWRYWDESSATDSGEPIASVLAIGPFKCGVGDRGDGMLDAVSATLGSGSATVGVAIISSHTAEGVVESCSMPPSPCYNLIPGWNPVFRPRVRGAWIAVVLSSTGRWAYEAVEAHVKNLGRLRP